MTTPMAAGRQVRGHGPDRLALAGHHRAARPEGRDRRGEEPQDGRARECAACRHCGTLQPPDGQRRSPIRGPSPLSSGCWRCAICARAAGKASFRSFRSFRFSGIMLGVATLIVVMAVLNGFRAELLDKILGFSGHATFYLEDLRPIAGFRRRSPSASRQGARASSASCRLSKARRMASRHVSNNTGALVRGIAEADLETAARASTTTRLITAVKRAGCHRLTAHVRWLRQVGRHRHWRAAWLIGIMLGLGSTLTIISPERPRHRDGQRRRASATFRSSPSSRSACRNMTRASIYMPLADAQELFRLRRCGATGDRGDGRQAR